MSANENVQTPNPTSVTDTAQMPNSTQIEKKQSRDTERNKNAELLAKALRPYFLLEDSQQQQQQQQLQQQQLQQRINRGRSKDKRICQLSAAYKYCVHLERTIKTLCESNKDSINNEINVPDDCKLIHNILSANRANVGGSGSGTGNDEETLDTILNENYNREYETVNECANNSNICLTPVECRNTSTIHESSAFSSVVTSSSNNCAQTPNLSKSNNKKTLKNVDASPIYGVSKEVDEFLNEKDEQTNVKKMRIKRRLIDTVENVEEMTRKDTNETPNGSQAKRSINALTKKQNVSTHDELELSSTISTPTPATTASGKVNPKKTPSSSLLSASTSLSGTASATQTPNIDASINIENRTPYFLRSTHNRLRYMLAANSVAPTKRNSKRENNKTKLNSSVTSSRS